VPVSPSRRRDSGGALIQTFVLNVNGRARSVDVASDTPLLWVLRDALGLTGSKFGCGRSLCGACTVHLDGQPVTACTIPVSGVGDSEITTIEGLSPDGDHPVQRAWVEGDVAQCGYCQAGQIMRAAALLAEDDRPSAAQVDAAMRANLCRCGTYPRIRQAVERAAELMREAAG
jgi:isoquinoline 1-oxidoreductase alpha subunit